MNNPRYIIITPAKNEERSVEDTLKSVASQNLKPLRWIILNDGSTDKTRDIIARYEVENDWIRMVDVEPFAVSEYSSRVVYLFRLGLSLNDVAFDYVMKLDADVSFDRCFCENIISEFENNADLGIASGRLMVDGAIEKNSWGDNTRGATKFYRKKCLDDIGGLYLSRGWDLMDDVAARCRGWKTRTLDYVFNHHKEEGIKSGLFKMHYDTGHFQGRVPYHPLFLFLKLISQIFVKPYFIAPFIQMAGYIDSRYIHKQRPFPRDISDFLRKEQLIRVKKLFHVRYCRNY